LHYDSIFSNAKIVNFKVLWKLIFAGKIYLETIRKKTVNISKLKRDRAI